MKNPKIQIKKSTFIKCNKNWLIFKKMLNKHNKNTRHTKNNRNYYLL
jgi:hypothetical protein